MEASDLYNWLNLGTKQQHTHSGSKSYKNIRLWLARRPHIQKAVIAEGLSRRPETDPFILHALDVYKCLYESELPSDFGLWCLHQAVAMADARPKAAEHLLERAVAAYLRKEQHRGLSIQVLQDLTTHHEELRSKLKALLSPPPPSPPDANGRKNTECHQKRRRMEQEWLSYVRLQEQALLDNRAPAPLLFELAEAYLGDIENVEEVMLSRESNGYFTEMGNLLPPHYRASAV